ncbi:MAG: DUF5320 domain-containing protein [Pirellulales bacterium]|nr:DUF5320 domain-containing protein [Pirellulales bacterium]
MPGGDRTGPMGMGPMTGRAAGYCAGFPTPGFMNAPGGRGLGGGRGGRGGRGWRNRFYATGLTGWQRAAANQVPPQVNQPQTGSFEEQAASPSLNQEQEVELLKQQAEQLSYSLEQIKQRLGELETPT